MRGSEDILGSAYLPYDRPEPSPIKEMKKLVMSSRAGGSQAIIDYEANAHHLTWGSNETNERLYLLGCYLMEINMTR